jgi:cytochrome c peroxidase
MFVQKTQIIAALFVLLLAQSCKKDETIVNGEDDALAALNLPSQVFNYAMPGLPTFYSMQPTVGADNTPAANPVTNAGATLGRVLFYDKNLSKNRTISCASCHQAAHGFSDPEILSKGFEGGNTGRHSMALANARYYNNGRFFWDERANTLEDQVLRPIQDEVEMGLTLNEAMQRIGAQKYYPLLFKNAFGDEQITADRTSKALAQFVRSMVSYTSKYDLGRAQVNNPNDPFPNFTTQENNGKQLFFAPNIGCAACHGTDAFVGPGPRNNGLDATTIDRGIGLTNNDPALDGAFKTTSLKNIALSAPYMHDGRFKTLEEVIEHYNSGVKNHPNLSPPLRLPDNGVRRLNLNQNQKDALVAFLKTLSDPTMLGDEKFSTPFK